MYRVPSFLRRSDTLARPAKTCAVYCLLSAIFFSANIKAEQFELLDKTLAHRANGILALMSFTLFPDITTSSLAIEDRSSGDPGLWQTSTGGGFTLSKELPLYLEGTLGYSRYDPKFAASNGTEQREIPTRWNSFSMSGGIGWDFEVKPELVVRPMFNFALGHVETDASLGGRLLKSQYDAEIEFLEKGRTNAYGLGGSLMLDLERFAPSEDVDLEMRYSYMHLRSFNESSSVVEGSFNANNLGLWSRWRRPSGVKLLDRPLRYVFEFSYTAFFGDQRDVLSFNHLTSVGAGLEIDTSAHIDIVSRARLLLRYMFGEGVSGTSIGLAVSF